jgi:Ca-activated chloride channel family protein
MNGGFELHDPWLLVLLVPIAVGARWLSRRRRAAAPFPVLTSLRGEATLRTRAARLVPWLQALALVLLVVAAARPRWGEAESVVRREGLAIQMVLDRSGSMEEDIRFGDRMLPRIQVVQDVFRAFVRGGDDLPGRPHDLIGLTTFARFPEESCPLVGSHEPLLSAVQNLRTVPPFLDKARAPTHDRADAVAQNPLNATAIGDGLARAVLSLIVAEEDIRQARADRGAPELSAGSSDTGFEILGKVVILLTDGDNNSGTDPLEAAELARANGVRVYTILLADREVRRRTLFGDQVVRQLNDKELDRFMATPRAIAEKTGGRAYMASDGAALREVYAEIDRLERTELGRIEYRSYRELFPWPLGIAVGLVLGLGVLGETWLRRAP